MTHSDWSSLVTYTAWVNAFFFPINLYRFSPREWKRAISPVPSVGTEAQRTTKETLLAPEELCCLDPLFILWWRYLQKDSLPLFLNYCFSIVSHHHMLLVLDTGRKELFIEVKGSRAGASINECENSTSTYAPINVMPAGGWGGGGRAWGGGVWVFF